MRTIITGAVVFLLWSSASVYVYVCHIKQLCGDKQEEVIVLPEAEPFEEPPVVVEDPLPEPEPVDPGMMTVYHDFDRSELIQTDQIDSYISELELYLNSKPDTRLIVTGNTDAVGPSDYNVALGMRRAAATRNYLVNKGIPESLILVKSNGEDSPIADNNSTAGRARNRRTEITHN